MATDIIIHDKKDNVGVVVIDKDYSKTRLLLLDNGKRQLGSRFNPVDEIPLGHKIAMVDLNEGETILEIWS